MKRILSWSGWAVAVVLGVIVVREACCSPDKLVLGPVRQDVVLGPLPASAMTNPGALLVSLNAYRTNAGWISASNGRIWAGLPGSTDDEDRIWSASYDAPDDLRNELTIWAGQGWGVSYQRQLFDHWSAGAAIFRVGDQTAALAGVGYRWCFS